MKPNVFKYSVLSLGIVAAMGITGIANAAGPAGSTSDSVFAVTNQATASYSVNAIAQTASSNLVTVNVSETGNFTLFANAADGTPNDDTNVDLTINPQAGETVDFVHTLRNTGNIADTYTIDLASTGADFQYDITASTISYQIKDADDADVGESVTIASDGTGEIPLKAQEYAVITVTANAAAKRLIDANGILTVTATSAYLVIEDSTNSTAVNTNNARTTTPVYAITNAAITSLGTKNFNVTNAASFVDYTITVTNEGNIDGTDVTITDTLPDGLTLVEDTDTGIYAAPTITTSGSSDVGTVSTSGKEIKFDGVNIAKGEVITITFRAKKDTTTPATGTDITTYVVVTDDVNDDSTFDLVDSSGDTGDSNTTENVYESATGTFANEGTDDNTDATITTSSQTRKLDISAGDSREVALLSDNIYTYTITNNGTDIDEATEAEQTYFTIIPTTPNDKVTIGQVFVDVNQDGTYILADDILLEKAGATENYDLHLATVDGLTPEEAVIISVEVKTTGTANNDGVNDLGKFELMTISVLPQGPIKSTPKPVDVTTTSTTTMQGIDLQKFQATADCGTAVDGMSWVKSDTSAAAGQCIFYKLDAKNTFTATDISDVVVSETLDNAEVTYQNDFASTTSGDSAIATDSSIAPVVTGTYATLVSQETGTITFSAKVSQTGTNAQ